jgi:hypothetical protein
VGYAHAVKDPRWHLLEDAIQALADQLGLAATAGGRQASELVGLGVL